jgi:Lrp/AsnC family leucine-responsive transcriptional regulator
MIDEIDARILRMLQHNARVHNAEIARQLGMAPSAIFDRIRKLEERGVIDGYGARMNARALGLSLLAFVFVRVEERPGEASTAAALLRIPEVQEIHHVAGEDCFLLKVRASDTEALGRLLREQFSAIPAVRSTRTTVVLESVSEANLLPLPFAGDVAEEEAVA